MLYTKFFKLEKNDFLIMYLQKYKGTGEEKKQGYNINL